MNQARVLDVSRYYRTGGVNWDLVQVNFDAVGIAAGYGLYQDVLLEEHVNACEARGIPYFTYHIPSSKLNPADQAVFYASLPGVADAVAVADLEPINSVTPLVSSAQALSYVTVLEGELGARPWIYSNEYYLNQMGNPAWVKKYHVWLAQYLYANWLLRTLYERFEPFLDKWGGQLPPSAGRLGLTDVVLWQFTEKGDAPYYAANQYTQDPIYRVGMKACDLNVSTIERDDFMAMLGVAADDIPLTLEQRVERLERAVFA